MGIKNPPSPFAFAKATEDKPFQEEIDSCWMQQALKLAQLAQEKGEVPVGAIIVRDNEVIGQGYNQPIGIHDPTAHAEIQAIRQAAQFDKNYRLTNTTLYVTLEPCAMCAGAIIQARINRVVFGASDSRTGAAGSVFNILQEPLLNHRCQVSAGIEKETCAHMLKAFFKAKRAMIDNNV